MDLRLANRKDAQRLSVLHQRSSANQPGGFMFQLGPGFLAQYYRILIDEGSSIILCAINDAGAIIGFVAGSMKAQTRLAALKKHRLRLFMAALPALLRKPSLFIGIYSRQNSSSADGSEAGYVIQSGPHEEFWAWEPGSGTGAIDLHLKWLSLMHLLGADSITGEVDKVNRAVVRIHRMLGARVTREFVTPDGRERIAIQYKLD